MARIKTVSEFMEKSIADMKNMVKNELKKIGINEIPEDEIKHHNTLKTDEERKEHLLGLYNMYSANKLVDDTKEKEETLNENEPTPEVVSAPVDPKLEVVEDSKTVDKRKVTEDKLNVEKSEYSTPIIADHRDSMTGFTKIEMTEGEGFNLNDNLMVEIREVPSKNGKYCVSVEDLIEILFKYPMAIVNVGTPDRALSLVKTIMRVECINGLFGFNIERKKMIVHDLLVNHGLDPEKTLPEFFKG